ncbi:hypothetical protein HY605_00015 [Candidatus Peregrinibacteria bacterium]|nr:hypothetical protein [Candidatus Peregrinibacteria bacterium]
MAEGDTKAAELFELIGPPFGPENQEGITTFQSVDHALIPLEREAAITEAIDQALALDRTDKDFGTNLHRYFDAYLGTLSPQEQALFEQRLALRFLDECKWSLAAVPSAANLLAEPLDQGLLKASDLTLRKGSNLIYVLGNIADILKSGQALGDIARNVAHDQGTITNLANFFSLLANGNDKQKALAESELRLRLDLAKELLQAIYAANSCIVSGQFNLADVDVPACLEPILIRILNRADNNYTFRINQGAQTGFITLDLTGMPDEIIADEAALTVILFNLLKNAVDKSDKQGMPILIKGRELNGNCLEISVRDFGNPIDIKKLRTRLTKTAREGQQAGRLLSRLETCLLDPHLSPLVPESAMTNALFSRTLSLSASGEGTGLSIVKSLVHGLNGDVRINNHPDGGVEVLITLPNTREKDPIARSQMVNAALLENL